jgi:F-type H+-transporting ATPase subunit b
MFRLRNWIVLVLVVATWSSLGGSPAAALADDVAVEGAEHAAPSPTDTNPLSIDPDLAIFTLIIFLIVLGILWKFAWGPISEALDRRERGIADQIQAAVDKHEESKRLLAGYEAKLAGAADEVRALLEEARRDAEHTKSEILAEAKAAAKAEHDRAVREVNNAKDSALKELAESSANLAIELAGKIVREKLSAGDQSRLVRDVLRKLPSTEPSAN